MAFISGDKTAVIRYAAGLYGQQLGSNTLAEVDQQLDRAAIRSDNYLSSVLNSYYAPFAGMTSAQVAAVVVANAGIVAGNFNLTAANVAQAVAVVTAELNFAAPSGNQGAAIANILAAYSTVTVNDPVFGAAAQAWNAKISDAAAFSATNTGNAAFGSVNTDFVLTTASDNLIGTSGNDTFVSNFNGDLNTLNSGDVISGGTGTDTLKATLGITPFAITPTITGVENIAITAQNDSNADSGQNNVSSQEAVQIDFGRVSGVKQIWNIDSRADLIVEDVRIQNDEITKDITIVMRDTDPGNVDYGVYFDQNSLRNVSSSTSTINLQVMDTQAVASGNANPLLNSPYGGFRFTATDANGNAQVVTLQSADIDNAQSYAALRTAFQAAADAQFGAGVVSVTLGSSFTVTDTTTAASVTGTEINITAAGKFTFTTPVGSGWLANGVVPANSGLHTNFSTGGNTNTALVTSTIILDNVGRGSTGGDLVVGGLSVGDTSTSKGVERFEITVEDNSTLRTVNSTNNTLREVTIKNGTTDEQSDAFTTTVKDAGNLTVKGNVAPQAAAGNAALPGSSAQHNAFGFSDVRLIDGSAMTGKLAFTSEITVASIAKYANRVDTAGNPVTDNVDVVYTGGSNDDTISLTIDGGVSASRSSIVSGQPDFVFNVNGGAGNDTITVNVAGNGTLVGGIENWAANQDLNNNITINGGAGNDTIRTPGAGDTTIDAGAGNDVVYTDNTGRQTVLDLNGAVGITTATTTSNGVWVFNTFDQVNAVANGGARNLVDLRSDSNDSYNFYKGTVTVTFKGIPAAAVTLANATTYKATDLEINQAIKQAINLDPTLSKLLVAQDGPGNTLVVTSLIDGVMTTADLAVTFAAAPAATVYSAAEIAGMATAYGNAAITTNALALAAQVLPNATRTDYSTAMAQDSGGTNIVGAASTSTSDNFVLPGTGNDVIVLGTTVGVDTARSSNEVVTLAAGFGDDVVVNFNVAGAGADRLNVGALLSGTPVVGALSNTANLITVVDEVAATNGTLALVTTLVKAAVDTAVQATATKQLYIVVSASNVGTVYSVTNGVAANDAVVVREGSVDLADTAWATLTAASFTTVGAQAEGASSAAIAAALTAVINAQVLVGTTGIDTLNTGGFDNITMTGLAGADTFNVTGGSNATVITDLATGDAFTVTNALVGGNLTSDLAVTVSAAGFVATSATTHTTVATGTQNTNAQVVLTAVAAGSTINMAAAGGTLGYTLTGAAGNDTLTGSAFADVINTGATGVDVVNGGAGDDTITAGGGTTTINGGLGNDAIAGGAGIDTINVTSGIDAVTAFGTGADVITVSAGAAANVTTNAAFTATAASSNAGVLNITAGAVGVLNLAAMTGSVGVNVIGNVGGNLITGTALADTITANAVAANTVTGGAGADTITLGAAGNTDTVNITSGGSADTINTFAVAEDVLSLSVAGLNATIPTGALVAGTAAAPVALAAGAVSLQGVAGAAAVANGTNVFELTGATFATSALMEAAIETAGARALTFAGATTAGQDIIVAWYDTVGNAHVGTYNIGTAGTTLDASGSYTSLAVLVGVAADALVAANFTIVA